MNFLVMLLLFLINYFIQIIVIKFEIKFNPDLFYSLYYSDINRILMNNDKKKCKKILKSLLKKYGMDFVDYIGDVTL